MKFYIFIGYIKFRQILLLIKLINLKFFNKLLYAYIFYNNFKV